MFRANEFAAKLASTVLARLAKAGFEEAGTAPVRPLLRHALCRIDRIDRCLLYGRVIPHCGKTCPVFGGTPDRYAGQGGNPDKPVVPVAVAEDQFQFISTHKVFRWGGDIDAALPLARKWLEHLTGRQAILRTNPVPLQ